MEVKKIKINGYNVYVHNTTKYSSIHMRFLFEMPYTRENIFKYDLLEEYQIHSAAKYKTRKVLNERRMELYSLGFGLHNYNLGEKMFTEATFTFYDPELVRDDYLGEALEFARDVLMYPNFEGGKLDKAELERCKANLTANVEDDLMSFKGRARTSFAETMFPNTYKMYDKIASKSEYEDIINSFSDADLIAAHDHLVNHCLVGLVIMGNVKDEHLKYIEELFKFEEVKSLDEEYNEIIPIDPNVSEFNRVLDEDYSESVIRAVYTYETSSKRDKLIHWVIMRMIGGSGLLIHKILRDEQGIVYSAGSAYDKKLDYILMIAYIDAKNADAALQGFDMVLDKLKDRDLLSSLLEKIKEEVDLDEYTFDESKWNVFFDVYDTSFNFDISDKEKNDIIRSITVDDVAAALTKLKRKTVHLYEGGKKNEK